MSALRRRTGWPGPVWLGPALALTMAVTGFLATRAQLAASFPRWGEVSAAWHEALWLPGVLLVMVAAAAPAVMDPARSALARPVRARAGTRALLRHIGVLGTWAAAGYTVGLLPIHIAAARGATWGRLGLGDVALGLGGVYLLVALGFAAGAAAGRPLLAAALVGPVVFALGGVTNALTLRPLGLLLPVRQYVDAPRFVTNPWTVVFFLLAAPTLALTAVLLAVRWRSRGSVRAHAGGAPSWVAASAALATTAFLWRPELVVLHEPVPVACHDTQGVRVCLHGADTAAAPTVDAVVGSARRAGLGGMLRTVTDEAAAERSTPTPGEAIVSIDPRAPQPHILADALPEQVLVGIVTRFTEDRCVERPGVSGERYDVATAVRDRIYELAGSPQLAIGVGGEQARRLLRSYDAGRIADLLRTQARTVETCSLTTADLRR